MFTYFVVDSNTFEFSKKRNVDITLRISQ